MMVIPETYQVIVIPETSPVDSYSRNASCALNMISTFLLFLQMRDMY